MGSTFAKLKFFLVVGIGFFGDGWLNSTIGLVLPMIGFLYFQDNSNAIPTVSSDVIKASFSIGMILGQILFGVFGDAIGRRYVYGKELIFTCAGALLVILLPWGSFSHQSVIAWLCCFRMLTGLGVGGDYPMSATIAAENDQFDSRAKTIVGIFAGQSIGYMLAGVLYLILLVGFKNAIQNDIRQLQWVWRLVLGIILVPLLGTLYYRLTMPESEPYKNYVAAETSLRLNDGKRGLSQQVEDFREYFSQWKHARALIATSLIWFLFDLAFYGVNLNQSIILAKIGYTSGQSPWEVLYKTAVGNLIVGAAGYMPGYYVGLFLPDLIGHKSQQFWGSVICTIIYAVWAGVTDRSSTGGLVALFTLSQFFLNAGLASTTFLIPVEIFPTRVRATAHGISAASGKLGAILTAMLFGTMTERIGIRGSLRFFAGCTALCAVLTFLLPESRGRSLEDIERNVLYSTRQPELKVGSVGSSHVLEGDSANAESKNIL